jgi:phenylacetate-CoA oxygenase PaaH subunit
VPDPDLKWNAETGHYEFGEIDWSEFHNVLKGNGPCNKERLRTRVKAWDDGEWFRDALVAYADKQAAKPRRKCRHSRESGNPALLNKHSRLRGNDENTEETTMSKEWPLWEVFIRSQHGLAHKHVGSLHAPDAEMAINNARDVYTRRNEGVSIWVVRAADIVASSPGDKEALFEPSNSKVYRHPTFFPMPEEVKNL